jgi:hypothetical protein
MLKSITAPTFWEATSEEGEKFYTDLANKYINLKGSDTPENLIRHYIIENVKFTNSEEGLDADASAKETQHRIIDFITELFSDTVDEDFVLDIWHEEFWK